ncbi:MAG: radical SAM protein, partial [Smithellaceae bacterium]|nr:radical SAM protein [Smithellaceae bacterium]
MINYEEILRLVEKPSRYLGGEVGAVVKDRSRCKLSFALAFPDVYEVGMSHLGLQILYSLLNERTEIVAERCYAPWPDMEAVLRQAGQPLRTLESRAPLSDFDVVGFSLQYELSYTNVLNMLDLGGIPLRRTDRDDGHPLVIAGGPCSFNPSALEAFVDLFVIGEGEEVLGEICDVIIRTKGKGRQTILGELAELEGVYVPSRKGKAVRKRTVARPDLWPVPESPIVPLMKTVHDRITLEIARGCTRGCRFCQAGMVWRPVRERNAELLEQAAEKILCATGYDEISLLSLSSGDYSRIGALLGRLMESYSDRKVALALPSLRVETLTKELIEAVRRVRKTSFTLAPEAGTQRMRNIINKGNTEEDLITTVRQVFAAGWRSVKLYFMIGLPMEGQEDLEGIVDLGRRALQQGKGKGAVTMSISTFVPKPHTPFQWHRQIGLQEIEEKQAYFKTTVRNRNLNIKWHDGRASVLEGIMARADARIGTLVEKAFRLGCRFDGWTDCLRFELWEEAMRQTGVNAEDYLRRRDLIENLPWEHIDAGISKEFLVAEYGKSLEGML